LANNKEEPVEDQVRIATAFDGKVSAEAMHNFVPLESEGIGEDGTCEIQENFRRMLAGLRRLPRRERAQALCAAREWRSFALNAARERRARERDARFMLWRQKFRPPAPP